MCVLCKNTGFVAADPPSDELLCLTFCPCDDGARRRKEGVVPESIDRALVKMWCPICRNAGINEDGEFCGCEAGRDRQAESKKMARAPRRVETQPRQRRDDG